MRTEVEHIPLVEHETAKLLLEKEVSTTKKQQRQQQQVYQYIKSY